MLNQSILFRAKGNAMPRSVTMRRTALLATLTAFTIPEMHAEPSHQADQLQRPDLKMVQAVGLGGGGSRAIQLEPTQRWVF